MYVLCFLLIFNGQVIEERQSQRFESYLDCVEVGQKIIATKPKDLNVVFQCREKELGKGVM